METKRDFVLHVRLTRAEQRALWERAEQAGKSASGLCRELLAPALVRDTSDGSQDRGRT